MKLELWRQGNFKVGYLVGVPVKIEVGGGLVDDCGKEYPPKIEAHGPNV